MDKKKATIQARQEREKALMLENLKKIPIVQSVCERQKISRATYYRWLAEDPAFKEKAEEAIREGTELINDLAENQLIVGIKEKNLGSIMWWLRHKHRGYHNKIELQGKIDLIEELSPKQKELYEKALRLAGINLNNNHEQPKPESK